MNPDKFIGAPILSPLPPWELLQRGLTRQFYRLENDFGFRSEAHGIIMAPRGMLTDLASAPKFMRSFVDNDGPYVLWPSIIHDAMYQSAGKLPNREPIERSAADLIMREMMLACEASEMFAAQILLGLRLGGEAHWGKKP